MTHPAVGTCDFQLFWANPQGVSFEFAEAWYNLYLRTAGRVMTLPYGCGAKNWKFTEHRCRGRVYPARQVGATEQNRQNEKYYEFA